MKKLLCLLLIMFTMNSYGSREGNGGDGVEIDGQVYLFDLYENYQHLSPVLETIEPDEYFQDVIHAHLVPLRNQVDRNLKDGVTDYGYNDLIREFTKKITAISRKDYLLGFSLFKATTSFNWSLVPLSLININDDDGSDIKNPPPLVQIAVRSFRSIKLDNHLIAKMDLGNFVATMVHEVIYALISPINVIESKIIPVKVTLPNGNIEEYEKVEKIEYHIQPARRVREIVSYLFSREINSSRGGGLKSIVLGSLPSLEDDIPLYTNKKKDLIIFNVKLYRDSEVDISSEEDLNKKIGKYCKRESESAMIREAFFVRHRSFDYSFAKYKGKDDQQKVHLTYIVNYDSTIVRFLYTNGGSLKECLEKSKSKIKQYYKDYLES